MSAAENKTSRAGAFAWVILAYLAGAGAAVGAALSIEPGALGPHHALWLMAIGDAVATVVVFGFSVAFDNSSFYDPYWSVAPLAVGGYWLFAPGGPDLGAIRPWLVIGLIALWAVRLTWNWARGWTGLGHEDWRYVDLRHKSGVLYWPVSFLGLHGLPTVLVFLGLAAVYPALRAGAAPLSFIDAVAMLVTLGAIVIEASADRQLRRFVLSKPTAEAILQTGLWRYSRHPNYFGEISFWWGLFFFGLAADRSWWWMVAAPVAMTALFLFISLPLIETRMKKRRPGYAARIRTTSMLIPWPPKRDQAGG